MRGNTSRRFDWLCRRYSSKWGREEEPDVHLTSEPCAGECVSALTELFLMNDERVTQY
jgi:hypothetical protein